MKNGGWYGVADMGALVACLVVICVKWNQLSFATRHFHAGARLLIENAFEAFGDAAEQGSETKADFTMLGFVMYRIARPMVFSRSPETPARRVSCTNVGRGKNRENEGPPEHAGFFG